MGVGGYPEVSLKEARDRCADYRKLLRDGRAPLDAKRVEVAQRRVDVGTTFKSVAEAWIKHRKGEVVPEHQDRITARLAREAFPTLGDRPIGDIVPAEVLAILRRVEGRGTIESAHRLKGDLSMIFRFGVASGACASDPTRDLKGSLTPKGAGQARAGVQKGRTPRRRCVAGGR